MALCRGARLLSPPLTLWSTSTLTPETIQGTAQLINQIYLDPLFLGPHCTLYFSDTNTASLGFPAEATYILPPDINLSRTWHLPAWCLCALRQGLAFDSVQQSAVAIENLPIQFTPSENWWMSVEFVRTSHRSQPTHRPSQTSAMAWPSTSTTLVASAMSPSPTTTTPTAWSSPTSRTRLDRRSSSPLPTSLRQRTSSPPACTSSTTATTRPSSSRPTSRRVAS